MDSQQSSTQPVASSVRLLTATAILLSLLIAIYLIGYVAVGKRGTISGPVIKNEAQFFRYQWQVDLFRPAATIESLVLDKQVEIEQWDMPR